MAKTASDKDTIFTKISTLVFTNMKVSIVVLIGLLLAGVLSYTTWLRREGFPPVQVPISFGVGQYFVDDAAKVDEDVAQPLADVVKGVEGVTGVSTSSSDNVFSVVADLESDISNIDGNNRIREAIESAGVLPESAAINFIEIDAGKFLGEYNVILSVTATDDADLDTLTERAGLLTDDFEAQELISRATVIDQFTVNPADESQRFKSSFARSYVEGDFKESVLIGLVGDPNVDFDIFDLDDQIQTVLTSTDKFVEGVTVTQSIDQTLSINDQINSLQSNVVTGALVVIVISALMISWRVSLITAVFIVSVLVVTSLVLLLAGYTLNVITLFSLLLALGLFVDDATIIAESIYAKRDKKKKPLAVIRDAIQSIGRASFMGTVTTILVFSPLLFITGILGGFIFQMPMTVIISLIVSFVLSITMIPILANYTILGEGVSKRKDNVIGVWLADRIRMLKTNRSMGIMWGIAMVVLSFGFIMGSGPVMQQLGQDIFPQGKDGNNLEVNINFEPGLTIERAEELTDQVGEVVVSTLGENVNRATLIETEGGNSALDGVTYFVDLIHYNEREIKAPALADQIVENVGTLDGARVGVNASGGGPPEAEFPFVMQIKADDLDNATEAANEILAFLEQRTSETAIGDEVTTTKTAIGQTDSIVRVDGVREITVQAAFSVEGSTEVTDAAEEDVLAEFTDERLAPYGLTAEDLGFDLGQESDFAESFNSLPIAGLGALVVMFVLLAIQFRSLFKPVLILMALPFSIFGVAVGLFITDNSLSFFSMIGIIGLIGIAVNNTILLVDNATFQQKQGKGRIEAIAAALQERFRPLVTTTLTTVAALMPLALFDPFWESLSISIIGGLVSSTLLVVTAFPFYYIGGTKLADMITGFVKGIVKN